MYTIIDYLKFYKEKKLEEVHWNVQDVLLCSILVYAPIKSYEGTKSLEDFYAYCSTYKGEQKENALVSDVYEILDIIKGSERYKDIQIANFQNLRSNHTQFGAATFKIKNQVTVAYKGTDYSLIGWLENFRLAYEYPTYTHKLAIDYLNTNVNLLENEDLVVCGHSKGGNLALVAAMESTDSVFYKVSNIYNFDGPGIRNDEFAKKKLDRIEDKLINIIPSASVVGVLMNNTEYTVVKSEKIGIYEHYPTSWNVFGECFIEGKLSNASVKIHESTTKGIENIDYGKMREAFEYIFQNLGIEYSSIVNLSFDDIVRFYGSIKNIDPEVKKSIDKILEILLQPFIAEYNTGKTKPAPVCMENMLSTSFPHMNLLFSIDRKCLFLLKNCMKSVIKGGGAEKYDVYVLHTDLLEKDKNALKESLLYDINWNFISVPKDMFRDFPVSRRYPEQIYYRLVAAHLLPEHVERILYLDVDTVVINSLQNLYHADFEGNWFMGCTNAGDLLTKMNQLRLGVGLEKNIPYINTGVLMMNLELLRTNLKIEDIKAYAAEKKNALILPDQDIMAALCGEKIKVLNALIYNMNDRTMTLYNVDPRNEKIDLDWVKKNSVVIHYYGDMKPWKKGYIGLLDVFYHEIESC